MLGKVLWTSRCGEVLEKSLVEKCPEKWLKGVFKRSVGEKSCREVLETIVEMCWKVLEKSVVDRGVFEKSVREVL